MKHLRCGPLAFLLTGLGWTLLMAVSGMALYVGTVRSTPLPATVRLVHAHGALIGGVLQMLVGMVLAMRRVLGQAGSTTQLGRFLALNVGTVGMLTGFWLHQYGLVGLAGLLAIGPQFPLCGEVYRLVKSGRLGTGWTTWTSVFLGTALVGGSLLGFVYSLALIPPQWMIYVRLAHVHVTVLGFVLVVSVGLLYSFLLQALQRSIWDPRLTSASSIGVLLGITGLLAGFGMAQIPVQLGAGIVLLVATLAVGYNLLRTWLHATSRAASADHLLLGILFLLMATLLGVLVAVNSLFDARPFPFGSLHLVAYTHMMFIGLLLHLTFGGFTTWLPELLAQERIASHKKRLPYAARLSAIMARWHPVQVGTLTLGTMGLAAVAALTWHYPMSAAPVQGTTWASLALLLVSFVIFAAKVGRAWGEQTDERRSET